VGGSVELGRGMVVLSRVDPSESLISTDSGGNLTCESRRGETRLCRGGKNVLVWGREKESQWILLTIGGE